MIQNKLKKTKSTMKKNDSEQKTRTINLKLKIIDNERTIVLNL